MSNVKYALWLGGASLAFSVIMMTFVSTCLGASVSISAEDQGNGGVLLTATGTFATCTTCDPSGENCSSRNDGFVFIPRVSCKEGGNGSATCTRILDRILYHGTQTFIAWATDCTVGTQGAASASVTLTLDNTPTVNVSTPSGSVSTPFNITGTVTFKPTLSANKGGGISAFINSGRIATKACTTANCDFDYQKLTGNLYTMAAGGPYTIKMVATNGVGTSGSDQATFFVDDVPIIPPLGCPESSATSCPDCNKE